MAEAAGLEPMTCKIWQSAGPRYGLRVNRKWSSKPNVLDIALAQGDNRFPVKLTDLGSGAIPDVTYSAP